MYFVNEEHEKNFVELLRRDKTYQEDFYRLPFFYMLSTNLTFNNIDRIYDFQDGVVTDVDIADKELFSSAARNLIRLAINIFSNHRYDNNESIIDIFSVFDEYRYTTVMHAIDMRMRCENYKRVIREFYEKHQLTHTPLRYY